MQCETCTDRLEAYHDGELSSDDAATMRAHLASCAECSATYSQLVGLSQRLKADLVTFPVPDVLRARIHSELLVEAEQAPRARARARSWPALAAAGLLIAVVSSTATWATLRGRGASELRTNEVLASHVRSLMPNHLVDVASTDQHNVKPWFNGRVDLSPQVPTLAAAGDSLVGGRLDYVAGRPVAVVVYARRQHVINVYSWPDRGGDAPPQVRSAQGYHLVQWHADNVMYWAVSDLNVPELLQFVAAYEGRPAP